MIMINHHEIEREISHTLNTITVDNDFVFQPPFEINAKTNAITIGVPVIINLFNDAFYFQIAIGDYKKSSFMQISIRLLMGEITFDEEVLALLNNLNGKLLYAKVLLNEEGEYPYLTLEHDFSAASMEQVNEAIYDFLNDLIDDDVSPVIEKLLTKMRD